MKNISDERLEKMLTNYCEADCGQSFVYDPDRRKPKIIPFARFRRTAVAAASLVLISVLSLTVYFLFGNKISTPIAVAPLSQGAATPSAPADTGGGGTQEQEGAAPTEGKNFFSEIIDWLFPKATESSSTAPTVTSPTNSANVPPTEQAGEKTTEPAHVPPTQPVHVPSTEKPTESAHVPLTEPITPTQKPTTAYVPPTQPPYVPPTEPNDPPCNDDPTEGEPYWYEPTEYSGEVEYPGYEPPTEGGGTMSADPPNVCAIIDSSLLDGNARVYCKVYSSSGKRLGSANLYDGSHSVSVSVISSRQTQLNYEIPDDLITYNDYYLFVFYDGSGRMLSQVQQYIEV
ncbi:MAG: hypothetical protein IJH07_08565 [Ruminococcus sp.]|nr:hypothetical protein [Ruminococcus sp.]